jgi:hypothetical protein
VESERRGGERAAKSEGSVSWTVRPGPDERPRCVTIARELASVSLCQSIGLLVILQLSKTIPLPEVCPVKLVISDSQARG